MREFKQGFWAVDYDDGDFEELNEEEVRNAILLEQEETLKRSRKKRSAVDSPKDLLSTNKSVKEALALEEKIETMKAGDSNEVMAEPPPSPIVVEAQSPPPSPVSEEEPCIDPKVGDRVAAMFDGVVARGAIDNIKNTHGMQLFDVVYDIGDRIDQCTLKRING